VGVDVGGNGVAVAEGAKVDVGFAGWVGEAVICGIGVHPEMNKISHKQVINPNLELLCIERVPAFED